MDKRHKKKVKRAAKKKKDKAAVQEAQNKMKKQMGMFDKMPKTCSTCSEVFPKTREAHMAWRVVVRNTEGQVRLFCPACQEKAKKVVENNNEI